MDLLAKNLLSTKLSIELTKKSPPLAISKKESKPLKKYHRLFLNNYLLEHSHKKTVIRCRKQQNGLYRMHGKKVNMARKNVESFTEGCCVEEGSE